MKIVSLDKVEKKKVNMKDAVGAWKQLPLGSEDGVPVYSYRVFTVEPGGHTPYHRHPFEHMNYVIDGCGVIVSEKEEHEIKKDSFALVLPDEIHQFKNTSKDGNLVIICAVPKEYE